MSSLLHIENLVVGPTRKHVPSHPVSCSLNAGQLLWIQGPNGSGKTTFVKAILGMAHIFSGQCHLPKKADISYLPQIQNAHVPWPITLKEVLALADITPPFPEVFSPEKWELPWNTASGGERQMVLFIRALRSAPELLIVDEPFNFLDQKAKQGCISLLNTYLAQGGAVMIIEHVEPPSELRSFMVPTLDFNWENSCV